MWKVIFGKIYRTKQRRTVGELAFIFKQRLKEDAKARNTDDVRVDKDLFKAGAPLDTYMHFFLLFYDQRREKNN